MGRGAGAGCRPEGGRGVCKKFPHNGNVFPGFFHTMEACFGHFSTQWKPVSRGFSTVWKTGQGAGTGRWVTEEMARRAWRVARRVAEGEGSEGSGQ